MQSVQCTIQYSAQCKVHNVECKGRTVHKLQCRVHFVQYRVYIVQSRVYIIQCRVGHPLLPSCGGSFHLPYGGNNSFLGQKLILEACPNTVQLQFLDLTLVSFYIFIDQFFLFPFLKQPMPVLLFHDIKDCFFSSLLLFKFKFFSTFQSNLCKSYLNKTQETWA